MKGSSAARPVILAVSCLVLGFVGGWSLASMGGDTVDLPDADVDVTVKEPAPSTTTVAATTSAGTPSGTTTGTGTGTSTGTGTGTAAATIPPRAQVTVRVLNASGVSGAAARTATTLTGLGYATVSTGNTAAASGTTVYWAADSAAAAERLADDLQVGTTAPLAGSAVASGLPSGTDVVVVLGR